MKSFTIIVLLAATCFQLPGQVRQTVETEDGFELVAQVWEQDVQTDLVLLLHQCDADQRMYQELGNRLFKAGFHVLSFDYRGQGLSIDEEFNEKKATDKRAYWNRLDQYATKDLDAIMKYSQLHFGKKLKKISLLGASCGGNKVIYLAEKFQSSIRSIGFLSSRLSDESMSKFDQLNKMPLLFIAATGDKRAYESSLQAIEQTTSTLSKIVVYHGTGHAKALFAQDVHLEAFITEWYHGLIH